MSCRKCNIVPLTLQEKNLRSFVISGHFDVCQFIIETTASLYVNDPFTPKRDLPLRTIATIDVTQTLGTSPETIA